MKIFVSAVNLAALFTAAALAGGALAASPNDNEKPHALSVTETPFGTMPDGRKIDMYHLKNAGGMEVDIITYGGTVQSIKIPDKNGKIDDVALGFDNLNDYLKTDTYFGALIGRYGNRIAKGEFTLDGKTYRLPINNGPNSLHGGTKGFDKKVWAASPIETPDSVGVELTLWSPDGDMGYPGDLAVTVRYTLDNDNDLRIHYSAVTDKPTVLNLTNHTYFNLAGAGSGTVLDQVAMINADKVTPVDSTLIPTGKVMDVAGTDLGFTTPTAIGAHIHADNQQLKYAEPKEGGYDFNYVLNNRGDLNALAASVTDPKSGRTIEMYTDEPGVQFYTSNFLHDVHGKDGKIYHHWGAFTLEAQHFPDSPNQPTFPSTELKPGEKYSQTTIYKFLPTNLPS
ncbi:MAG TPA: aldose epimerase family protein [Roseiarcus sp.]|jgi:aldose 1-epimerase|nr:aldose epimerase family protein [Roseiarcus sp.]